MQKLMQIWNNFAEKHPKLSVWVREGGFFIIISNLITIFKYLILTFLPAAFAFMGNRDFGFPGSPPMPTIPTVTPGRSICRGCAWRC